MGVKMKFYKAESHTIYMSLDIKKLTPQERYQLIGKLIEEIKLKKAFLSNRKSYILIDKVS